jgi:hypothetical protein
LWDYWNLGTWGPNDNYVGTFRKAYDINLRKAFERHMRTMGTIYEKHLLSIFYKFNISSLKPQTPKP